MNHHGVHTLAIAGLMTLANVGINTGILKYGDKHFPLGGALCLVGTRGSVLVCMYLSVSVPTRSALNNPEQSLNARYFDGSDWPAAAKCLLPSHLKSSVERYPTQTRATIESRIFNYPHLTFDINKSHILQHLSLLPSAIAKIFIIWFFIQAHAYICLWIELCGHVETRLLRMWWAGGAWMWG